MREFGLYNRRRLLDRGSFVVWARRQLLKRTRTPSSALSLGGETSRPICCILRTLRVRCGRGRPRSDIGENMAEAEFMHRWFEEVWNNQNEAAIDEMFAEDGIGYGLGAENIVGPADFKVFHRAFVSAYPDLRVTVEDTVV